MRLIALILILPVIIQSCTEEEEKHSENAPEWFELVANDRKIERTYKDRPLNLPVSKSDLLVFSTSFSDQTISINLFNNYIHEQECHPYLVTRNCIGKCIDTLFPFRRNPYYGLDSHYNPYLEITSDGQVVVTDSGESNTYTHQLLTLESGEKVFALIIADQTNYVSTRIFDIQQDGTFGEIAVEYEEY